MNVYPLTKYCDCKNIQNQISEYSSDIKVYVGATANCAFMVMQDAYDKMKKHYLFRGKTKQLFNLALEQKKKYRNTLLNPQSNRLKLFYVEGFAPETKDKYIEGITKSEYYDFWEGVGGAMYVKSRRKIEAMNDRFVRALTRMGVRDAEALSHAFTAANLLELSVGIYNEAVEKSMRNMPPIKPSLDDMLHDLSVEDTSNAWQRAIDNIVDVIGDFTPKEYNALKTSGKALRDYWFDPRTIISCHKQAVKDFDDMFRSKKIINDILSELECSRKRIQEKL